LVPGRSGGDEEEEFELNVTIAMALKSTILSAALAVFSLSGAQAATKAPPKLAGDAVAGAASFKIRCVVCHGIKADGGPIAPSLIGVFGRKAATTSFANYSDALKGKGLTWTAANLDKWLTNPSAIAPGTVMSAAVPAKLDRDNLIAYLATLK
jgi:cytochrome c2